LCFQEGVEDRLLMGLVCRFRTILDTVSKSAVIAFPRGCSRTDFGCGSDALPSPFSTQFPSQRSLRFQEGVQGQTSDVVQMWLPSPFGHCFQVSGHCVSKRVFKNRLPMWFGCTPKPFSTQFPSQRRLRFQEGVQDRLRMWFGGSSQAFLNTVSKSAAVAFPKGD
jgi:hypothetical protein